MAASLRNSDKIGRYSEERLLILLPATDRAGADIWLQRFLAGAGNDLRASVVELDPGRDLASQLEQPWNT
jgi:GGDEF domain-containing protein